MEKNVDAISFMHSSHGDSASSLSSRIENATPLWMVQVDGYHQRNLGLSMVRHTVGPLFYGPYFDKETAEAMARTLNSPETYDVTFVRTNVVALRELRCLRPDAINCE